MFARPRENWLDALDVLLVAAAIGLMAYAYSWGWELRRSAWSGTLDIRFTGDIQNARYQAHNVLRLAARRAGVDPSRLGELTFAHVFDGYRATYDAEADRADLREEYRAARVRAPRDTLRGNQLDYPPLRLAVMTLWTWNNVRNEGHVDVEYRDEPVEPLLDFNAMMTLLACGAAFLLVYDVRRGAGSRVGVSAVLAAIVACATWLSPAIVLNSHAWPQWDVWVLPGLLWSAYFAKSDRWALAGATLALFGMFKGQVFLAATPIVVWSVFANATPRDWIQFTTGALALVAIPLWLLYGRASSATVYAIVACMALLMLWNFRSIALLRCACGVLAGAAAVLWMWLVRDVNAWVWVIACTALATVLMMWPRARAGRSLWWCLAIITPLVLAVPALRAGWLPIAIASAWAIALALASRFMQRGRTGLVFGTAGLAVLLLGMAYGGSWSFVEIGFPTSRYSLMSMGANFNLPSLLYEQWDWRIDDEVLASWTIRDVLRCATMAILALAGVAMALHARRNDPRLLAAIALPMLAVYTLLPQMHERYLLYPASMAALLLALNAGGWLIWSALVCLSSALMLHSMFYVSGVPARWETWANTIMPLHPGAGFAVLVLFATVLLLAFTPGWRTRRESPARASRP